LKTGWDIFYEGDIAKHLSGEALNEGCVLCELPIE